MLSVSSWFGEIFVMFYSFLSDNSHFYPLHLF